MSTVRATLLRPCAIALLVLVVSPVTAPFSTCDLLSLFGDQAGLGSALLQPKPSSDHALPGPSGHAGVSTPRVVAVTAGAAMATAVWGDGACHTQLRI